jgi:transcriptional regulator with XRE-family HTH domain
MHKGQDGTRKRFLAKSVQWVAHSWYIMVLNLSKILQQKDDVLQGLRDRTKTYLSKWGYSQKQMASAVGISETYLSDFLNGRRGMSEIPFAKIEHILSLSATQRKLQFYKGGNTGARMANLQSKGHNIKGQVKFSDRYADVIDETHAAFSKITRDRMEA